jgi:hypothetical protein
VSFSFFASGFAFFRFAFSAPPRSNGRAKNRAAAVEKENQKAVATAFLPREENGV